MARAESRDELLELTGGCLRDLGFRSYLAELEGDRFRLVADHVETEVDRPHRDRSSASRYDPQPAEPASIPLHPCRCRQPLARRPPHGPLGIAHDLVPHLSAGERAALRLEIGSGPFTAVPVERGDELLGVLITWRNGAGRSRRAAVPAGGRSATRPRLASRREPAPWKPARASTDETGTTPDLVRALIESGGIRPAMQPIVRLLDGVTLGYESLCRINPGAGPQVPSALFDAAGGSMEKELDEACIRAGLEGSTHTLPATLFLNVMLPTLAQPNAAARLTQFAEDAGVDPEHVVLEISERVPVPECRPPSTRRRRPALTWVSHRDR